MIAMTSFERHCLCCMKGASGLKYSKINHGCWVEKISQYVPVEHERSVIMFTPRPLAKATAPFPRMQFQDRLSDFIPVFSATAAPRISPKGQGERRE